ncbi:type II toxin-antitoxin system prevent-host-death family antitoxin [Glycomyces sp. A-F 0318]|uniref:type II toxin-antitoxin system Phd/YefM family antitoxin n=1 Tax=Glycomyces amatae TaxID=2881355 RepID=UPI001E3A3543|nr:type II toxin-antitoxin system prevent-host-death family antitoxin [Glycomyces amatae]MCD0446117.1 type II toxin-antitoxin system prevent-host-death family antitoxin [Glycomyces amatae]
MSEVSVREFSRNPSAFLALVERGESMTVTKRGEPIAIVSPAAGPMGKYAKLVAEGRIRLKSFTTDDIDQLSFFDTGDDDLLEKLLAEREAERDRDPLAEISREETEDIDR